MIVGQKIQFYREYLGFSLAEAASAMQLSEAALKSIESGEAEPDVDTIERASLLFGARADALVNGQCIEEDVRDAPINISCHGLTGSDTTALKLFGQYLYETGNLRST